MTFVEVTSGSTSFAWQAGQKYVERACSPWTARSIAAPHFRQGWPDRR
jgi:hypothetical protein